MKNIPLTKLLFFLAVISLSITSCLEDQCDETRTFIEFQPVYVSDAEMRIDITTKASRELETPGKIYSYEKYIFINELRAGVHVFDNSNPESPQNIGFIEIPGNVDIAIRGDVLYADNYADLVVVDISNPESAKMLCRMEDVYNQYGFWDDRGYLVYYEETERTIEVDCQDPNWNQGGWFVDDVLFAESADAGNRVAGAGGGTGGSVGTGGSLARFTIAKDHLYAVDQYQMYVFDLANPKKPRQGGTVGLGWGIETIWPYKDLLFIGGNSGMQIFSNDDPSNPYFLSEFSHATACDPVYADDTHAYVTLRDGRTCETFTNQLDVINIEDLKSPYLVKSYDMDHPHGLSKNGDNLYLCEGEYGLKVFDVSDVNKIDDNRLDHVKDIEAYDVISLSENHILVGGKDGLYQYDTTDKSNLKMLSLIATKAK